MGRDRSRPRRSRHAPRSHHHSHQPIRATFFAIASAWGFLAGMVALAMAQRSAGLDVAFTSHTFLFLVPGVLAACVGGLIAAAAYRENRRRH